jgi:hypothetical protein
MLLEAVFELLYELLEVLDYKVSKFTYSFLSGESSK